MYILCIEICYVNLKNTLETKNANHCDIIIISIVFIIRIEWVVVVQCTSSLL